MATLKLLQWYRWNMRKLSLGTVYTNGMGYEKGIISSNINISGLYDKHLFDIIMICKVYFDLAL